MGGIRAELKIYMPAVCPVVTVSSAADAPATSVSKAVHESAVVEEFVLDADADSDPDLRPDADVDAEEIFSYGSKRAYRFERSPERNCPCDDIEGFGVPLLDTYARNETLILIFHVPDIERLQDIVTTLQDRYSNVSVHRLVRTGQERSGNDLAFVDRSRLTDRQLEALETAHEMGYFDHPKEANAGEVAAELNITQSTFIEHLAAAQRKVLSNVLED